MDFLVQLDSSSVTNLLWWRNHIDQCAGKSLEELKPDLIIYSDASLDGWGAVMNDAYATGPWSSEYLAKHINKLEILAAFNALRAFAYNASNVSIHFKLDNATSVSYINRCGGTHSFKLREVALNIINIYSRPSI